MLILLLSSLDHAKAHEEAELAERHDDAPEVHEEAADGAEPRLFLSILCYNAVQHVIA